MSWPPSFDYTISFGELLQIVIALFGMGVGLAVWAYRSWKHHHPIWVSLHDGQGRHRSTAQLARGASVLTVAVNSRVPRRSSWYQLELMERDWQTVGLTWIPTRAPLVTMSQVQLHVTNGGGPYTPQGTPPPGAHLIIYGATTFCAAGTLALINLTLTSPDPWKGGMRVEVGSQGEATQRVVLPISVT